MSIELTVGLGCTYGPNIKKASGIYLKVGKYCLQARKRSRHEVPHKYGEGERFHWWRSDSRLPSRAGLSDSIYIPFGSWCVDICRTNKEYADLVGYKAPSINWIIDEFDHSFNDLAVASLRYHMDHSVCYCEDDRRDTYQDIIDRLNEPCPDFTAEEMAILEPPGWTFEDELEPLGDGTSRLKPATPERREVFGAYRLREDAWYERQDKARHDFVDVMRGLWS